MEQLGGYVRAGQKKEHQNSINSQDPWLQWLSVHL